MRIFAFIIAILVFSACSPTPRPEAVAAVIDAPLPTDSSTAPPLSTQFTPFIPILGTQAPVVTESVVEQFDLEISTPTVIFENPDASPTPHPDLPATCAAQPPQSAVLRDLGYINSICRAPVISPDGNWLAFAQLTESYTGDELWLVERESGNQTLLKDPLWTTTSYSAVGIAEWSATNELLIIHNLATGTAPASVLDPVSGQITNLGGISSLAWNADRTAVVGWEFRAGCRFTRAIGFDFETDRVLHSATPEDEIVGRVYWTPAGDDFVYSRGEIVGECPGCYYRSAELIMANTTENIFTTLVSDASLDYLLLGYQGNSIAIGERAYTYHTCEAPEVPDSELTYYLLDPAEQRLTPVANP